jgi:type III restriction enzyme
MLSEGWDARNVTQILGLRAFQSQLLCEQVVGRGLRRADYTDLTQPEYVDVYGVPFQLLPFARASAGKPVEPPRTTTVRSLREREKEGLLIRFPRVEQIITDVGDVVEIDMDAIEPIIVSSENDPLATWVEFEVGAPGKGIGGETQDRNAAYESFRLQRLVFRVAADLLTQLDKRDRPWLFPQLVRIVRDVVHQRVQYASEQADPRELGNWRYIQELENRIVAAVRSKERHGLLPVLNVYDPIGDTRVNFSTIKPAEPVRRSHISHAVVDSGLELHVARALDRHRYVEAFAKNERMFFEIPYRWQGTTGRYRPDFIVRLSNQTHLIIETKGRKRESDDAKHTAAHRWVAAVNGWGQLGTWAFAIARTEAEAVAAVEQHGNGGREVETTVDTSTAKNEPTGTLRLRAQEELERLAERIETAELDERRWADVRRALHSIGAAVDTDDERALEVALSEARRALAWRLPRRSGQMQLDPQADGGADAGETQGPNEALRAAVEQTEAALADWSGRPPPDGVATTS